MTPDRMLELAAIVHANRSLPAGAAMELLDAVRDSHNALRKLEAELRTNCAVYCGREKQREEGLDEKAQRDIAAAARLIPQFPRTPEQAIEIRKAIRVLRRHREWIDSALWLTLAERFGWRKVRAPLEATSTLYLGLHRIDRAFQAIVAQR